MTGGRAPAAARIDIMNVIAIGLANAPAGVADIPLRDTFALVLLFTGIGLLLVASYLLFAGCAPSPFPTDPARAEK